MKQKNKKIISDIIFSKHYEGIRGSVPFSDLPKDLLDTDMICIGSEDAYYSENNSYDAYTELCIYRDREETDEEYAERIKDEQNSMKELKDRRYQTYLRLKKEFENEIN